VDADKSRSIELLPHGEIGESRAHDLRYWHVAEEPDGHFLLVFSEGNRPTYRLRDTGEGVWTGRRLSHPQVEAVAVAEAEDNGTSVPDDSSSGLISDMLRAAGFPASDPASDRMLADALVLLDRVEPGVARRLERLAAERAGEPLVADRLRTLAAYIGTSTPERRAPDIAHGILGLGYALSRGKMD
jgi:hypothetical protein